MKEKMNYIGGLDSNQRGAVGTHTAGIISGFKENGFYTVGYFLEGVTPKEACDEEILVQSSSSKSVLIRAVLSRFALIRRANLIDERELAYHRFDPFLTPFLVSKNTIIEYNDDVLAQVKFAAANGQWSPLGTALRQLFYPVAFRLSERYCFRRARAVVAVTEKLKDFVLSVEPRANAIFIQNGSSAIYHPDSSIDKPLDYSILQIGHIGTLTHWDGLIDFLEGLEIFHKRNPTASVCFRIVGDGNLKPQIEKTIQRKGLEKSIFLEPSVSHADAIKILQSVDLVPLLKTIDSYGLSPMKYYEALALGCFLVCSDIDHINEVPDDSGIVVPFPFTSEDIATALEDVHRRLAQIRSTRKARAQRAQLENSWKNRVREIMSSIGGARN